MASITRRLLLQSRQCPSRIRTRATPRCTARPLSTTPARRADEDATPAPTPTAVDESPIAEPTSRKHLTPEEITALQLAKLAEDLKAMDPEVVSDAIRKGKHGIPFAQDFELETDEDFVIEADDKRKSAQGFWSEGEEEEDMGPDEDYYGDDVTSHGHGLLDQHRELRGYARLIAWELPLLSQLARPFTPPTPSTPFRFRYTSYLGETHPATNKVVVEFSPTDLSLPSPTALSKLIKLAGPRYNPTSQTIKLSCETHTTQAQNKRALGETITALIAAASDTADTFEDVPFDFRHHKRKPRFEFPARWAMTQERRVYLEGKRRAALEGEDQRLHTGKLVDGRAVIETSLPFLTQAVEEVPVPVLAGRGRR
ncbi:hypothetical protein P153DRAFT_338671 [Dothidotthia symphoricarpi CBS 119687]|uniref:Small ribosomal subunit protein mS35 mitochondrial conserved domain-containing protein n=1 Tax=Dothidotthia symphoricarpi CBS 119687 TaxID=1392245 RepID=A0A6A6AGE7_9PLEO|nr:uncharacterized protein P153DRAFT_338671 [Dothidotthia symphoricarpi CBS 119687]KAF2130646.1 hypothetical protein P153DRAFT_338671 [Dothidotthia symphoricarpi CBS 119687]